MDRPVVNDLVTDLVAEVLASAIAEGNAEFAKMVRAPVDQSTTALRRHINWYLSQAHRDNIDHGCPVAGFAGEELLEHGSDRLMITVKRRSVETAVGFYFPPVLAEFHDIFSHDILLWPARSHPAPF